MRQDRTTRHVCPRNCYDSCGIVAQVRNGKMIGIAGDPTHGYTKGKLCAKGYCYIRRIYSKDRLRYPLRQLGRGTGKWQELSWDEALDIICGKILSIKDRYGSTLPICLNKYSGNFGLLNFAIEGLFNSIGPTTQVLGSPCWSAGLDAQHFDFGNNLSSDPENISKSKLIILWGVNPVWTAVHSLPYVFEAQKNGAKVIVIDPVLSETAKKADWYIQVKPGQDGALALALSKLIIDEGKEDKEFLAQHSLGSQEYIDYLGSIDLGEMARRSGIEILVIRELAKLITDSPPVFIWIGFGMQRYINGGQNTRAIDALGALTGNIGKEGGGVQFAGLSTWKLFQYNFLKSDYQNRLLNINRFAHEMLDTQDPPVKMLWISNRNLFRQDADLEKLMRAIKDIELIVTVEQFMTETTQYSDIVLPTTTSFEEMDVVSSYWHHWVALNEQAIPPLYEARSDLEIAKSISKRLNSLRARSCSFPEEGTEEYFLEREFSPETYDILGIEHWSALKDGPVKARIPSISWQDRKFETPSGKYEFYSRAAQEAGHPVMPIYCEPLQAQEKYPFRLLNPHSQHCINSQFRNLDWIQSIKQEPKVCINPDTAKKKKIQQGDTVCIFNQNGEIMLKAELSDSTPADTLLFFQGTGDININKIIQGVLTDMGMKTTGSAGLALSETFVDLTLHS